MNPTDGYAYQHSFDLSQHTGSKAPELRPTATAHLIIFLADVGLSFVDAPPSSDALTECVEETSTGIRAVSDSGDPLRLPSYHRLLDNLAPAISPHHNRKDSVPAKLSDKDACIQFGADISRIGHCEWACRLIKASSHYIAATSTDSPNFSELICLGHLLHSFQALLSRLSDRDTQTRRLLPGLIWLSARLLWLTRDLDNRARADGDRRHYLTAYELYLVASGIRAARSLFEKLHDADTLQVQAKSIYTLLGNTQMRVATVSARTVDHYLARRLLDQDPDFDPVCLSFALRSHQLASEQPLSDSLHDVAVQELVRSQLRNGCWPDGFAAPRNGRSTATASQPSAEVALMLASVCFSRSMLVRASPTAQDTLGKVISAFSQFADFSEATVRRVSTENGNAPIAGWSNDRSRSRSATEMWIPCLMGRAFHLAHLLAQATQRQHIIAKYNGRFATSKIRERGLDFLLAEFDRRVQEQDAVSKPVGYIRDRVLTPLGEKENHDHYIIKPNKRSRSFILFGPPGSGKTHLLTSLSASLGWPVIELNPGDFIRKGIERIEEVAFEVFSDIEGLFHTIVHFDECDGLFADRNQGDSGSRNILSFATAAMLPKLQRLHDHGSVLFVLSTNAVRAIDDAARRQDRFDRILLWDRPDLAARQRIISGCRNRLKLATLDAAKLEALALETGGLPFNDVEAAAVQGTVDAGGRGDYIEWWRLYGFRELKAARFTKEEMLGIQSRLRREVPDAGDLDITTTPASSPPK